MSVLNQPIEDSRAATQAVAAPTAGATVVTTGVLPAGTYRVTFTTVNVGTAETTAAGLFNMAARKGSAIFTRLNASTTPVQQVVDRVTVDGTVSVNIIAEFASIAGSLYLASICATRLGV